MAETKSFDEGNEDFPCMRAGLTKVQPGFYHCAGGHLHIRVTELLQAFDYANTPHNQEMLCREMEKQIRIVFPHADVHLEIADFLK